jgi:hypothetical protein
LHVSAIGFWGAGQGAFVVRAAGAPLNCEHTSLPLELFDPPLPQPASARTARTQIAVPRSAMRQP